MQTTNHTLFKITLLVAIISVLVSCKGPGPNPQQRQKVSFGNPEIYVTAKNGTAPMEKVQGIFEEGVQPDEHFPAIMLDASRLFQTLEGIGGALTDASAETFYKLPEDKQRELIDAYFSSEKGIGYSLCRTHINSCDFSSESYAYSGTPGDTELKDFSIGHDLKHRIPFIKEALKTAGGNLRLFASPWSPPAWMKTNNNMLQGGKLKAEYYPSWANYFVKFLEEYKKEGIDFWGVTVQNEPMAVQTWESCIFTAEEERDFVKGYLGPAIAKSQFPSTKIVIWDHNRGIMYQRAKTVYDDPEASKYVWGTGFHWYTGDHFENVKLHSEAFPDKKMLFTEGCNYPFNYDSLREWHWGETYGRSIIHDFNNGASGWVDWNILLDETGGPNHVNNFCLAPVIGNTKTGELIYTNSFFYLGHFSKFLKPGARRIICSSNDDNLIATAFINPDGTVVSIIQNETAVAKDFLVWLDNRALKTNSPAHSIITVVIK